MKQPFKLATIICAVLLLLSTHACKEQKQQDTNAFTITVTGGKHFPEGARVLLYRHETTPTPEGIEKLADEKFVDGTFTYKGTVDDVHLIFIDVVPSDSQYPIQRILFPLEPENITIDFKGKDNYTFKGGKYGELLVNSFNNNDALNKLIEEMNEAEKDMDFEDSLQVDNFLKLSDKFGNIRQDILNKVVASDTKDPLLKLLAFGAGYRGDSRLDRNVVVEQLAKEVGENHRQSKVALLIIKLSKESAEAQAKVKIGDVIKDFEAKNRKGEVFHLANVLKENKYVLVEFWASWCGPCRGEIPHMKKAYSAYKDKGFEIVSFTLDNKKEAWEKASKEEQIPWIDTGDLLAMTSPVVKLYGVTGVPANYLVEASTGKIVAKDLRQEKLDNKLAELLGK